MRLRLGKESIVYFEDFFGLVVWIYAATHIYSYKYKIPHTYIHICIHTVNTYYFVIFS